MKFNFKSDFELALTLTMAGELIHIPEGDFRVVVYTNPRGVKWQGTRTRGVCSGVAVDGDTLRCYIDNPGFTPGRLVVEFYHFADDTHYADDTRQEVTPTFPDIELVESAGDGYSAEVVVPFDDLHQLVEQVEANTAAIAELRDDIPTALSELTNDTGFITAAALQGYATEVYVDNIVGNINAILEDIIGE